jgi:3-deoxy-manno-octulosonate cytidylyltransferase (CMP-KDO synthetase)
MLHSIVRMRRLGVIPARFASSRFPGKALALVAGKPMLEHVWERATKSRYLSDVVVATDDERIAAVVRKFGGRVRMTSAQHATGTDRLAEVASAEEAALYVNIQGDEPLIDPDAIDAAVLSVLGDESVAMGTLKRQIVNPSDIGDPNVVKVVTNLLGDAIYFSRYPIPYEREGPSRTQHYKHVGLYVYRREFLLSYPDLSVGPLEQAERLEQLRALENGYRIRVEKTEYESLGVDTPEDLERVNKLFAMSANGAGARRRTGQKLAESPSAALNTAPALREFPRRDSCKPG